MKRTGYIGALVVVVALSVSAVAQDSLADAARNQRQAKKTSTAKVYTNDDFAAVPQAPAVTTTDSADKAAKTDSADKPAKDEKTESDTTKPKAEDKDKLAASLKSRADEQKKNITQLQRELDIAQREYRLKVAVYYADAGNSLRDGKKFAEEDKKQREEIESKQKAVADAKQKLADIQEEARRSGVKAE